MQSPTREGLVLLTIAAYYTSVVIVILSQAVTSNWQEGFKQSPGRESLPKFRLKRKAKVRDNRATRSSARIRDLQHRKKVHCLPGEKADEICTEVPPASGDAPCKPMGTIARNYGNCPDSITSKRRKPLNRTTVASLMPYPYGQRPKWPASCHTRSGRPSRPTWKLIDGWMTNVILKT